MDSYNVNQCFDIKVDNISNGLLNNHMDQHNSSTENQNGQNGIQIIDNVIEDRHRSKKTPKQW